MKYQVVDCHTGQVIRSGLTQKGAYRAADRLDREYGAVRFVARPQP